MRYVSINSVPNGSTGAVMQQVTEERRFLGDECWCIWGRGRDAENDHEFNFGDKAGLYLDIIQTRLDGKAGFHSARTTYRLLRKLDEIKPDVVHLHNIHGYYVNIEMLFGWLVEHDNVQVNWTLHDCWAFTGHCAYFTYAKCEQWKVGCSYSGECTQLDTYPKTISKQSCSWNYDRKKRIFTQLSTDRVKLITPSYWLKELVKESFLSKYPVEVRHNKIDPSVFKRTSSNFREQHSIDNKFMILGVANPWTERKGLEDLINLSLRLEDKSCVLVLIGLSKKQIKSLPKGVIGLGKTDSAQELASIYSAADVFVNTTKEDNYPTVNLEAEACGTPVITYNVGGCKETLHLPESIAVNDFASLLSAVRIRMNNNIIRSE